ncbi:MAG: hypothetical protein OHK0053_35270 [Microscillaceae bacterium]
MEDFDFLGSLLPQRLHDRLLTPDQLSQQEDQAVLMDLGYLPDDFWHSPSRYPNPDLVLQQAWQSFRQEYRKAGLLPQHLPAFDLEADETERQLMALLLDLDGDFDLPASFALGEKNLFTRVLHYRLGPSGLAVFAGSVSNPFSAFSLEGLQILGRWLGTSDLSVCIQLSGDLPALTRRLFLQPVFQNQVVFFRQEGLPLEPGLDIERNRPFRRRLQKDLGPRSAYRLFYREVVRQGDYAAYIEPREKSLENQFLIRLLQLRQWMLGFYAGRPDGIFGPLSFQSLVELADMEDLALNEFLAYTRLFPSDQYYWVVNISYLLQEVMDRFEREEAREDLSEAIPAQLALLVPLPAQQMEQGLAQVYDQAQAEAQLALKKGRRMYRGQKARLKSFWHGLKGILKRIWDFLKGVATQILRFVREAWRFLLSQIRTAWWVLREGMGFLLGRRVFITPSGNVGEAAISDFDIDFDGLSLYPAHLGASSLDLHLHRIRQSTARMQFCLQFLGRLLGWLKNAWLLGIGWLGLGLKMMALLKELLREKPPTALA